MGSASEVAESATPDGAEEFFYVPPEGVRVVYAEPLTRAGSISYHGLGRAVEGNLDTRSPEVRARHRELAQKIARGTITEEEIREYYGLDTPEMLELASEDDQW